MIQNKIYKNPFSAFFLFKSSPAYNKIIQKCFYSTSNTPYNEWNYSTIRDFYLDDLPKEGINNKINNSKNIKTIHISDLGDYYVPTPKKNDLIYVAMSSGVDSSVTACLLAKEYKNVIGIYMANWNENENDNACLVTKNSNNKNLNVKENPTSRLGVRKVSKNKINEKKNEIIQNNSFLTESNLEESHELKLNISSESTCTESEWMLVQKLCNQIGIQSKRITLEKEYWQEVFTPMIENYIHGKTPNPDTDCNRYIKFGHLLERILKTDSINKLLNQNNNPNKLTNKIWLATGHYARILEKSSDNTTDKNLPNILLTPKCKPKDQTLYLSRIKPNALSNILFPLGGLEKSTVRQIAMSLNLITAKKPDSQGLCFVNTSYNFFDDFLDDYITSKKGKIIALLDEYISPLNGEVLPARSRIVGTHNGIWNATIGQRARISMLQGDPQEKGVWYVAAKNFNTNTIYIVKGKDNPALYSKGLKSNKWTWIINENIKNNYKDIHSFLYDMLNKNRIQGRFHSLQKLIPIEKITFDSNINTNNNNKSHEFSSETLTIEFKDNVRAISPGQTITLYLDNSIVLGGGIIQSEYPLKCLIQNDIIENNAHSS